MIEKTFKILVEKKILAQWNHKGVCILYIVYCIFVYCPINDVSLKTVKEAGVGGRCTTGTFL